MNFLKKGPEIKLPTSLSDVRVPGFLRDAYRELDERHLLPLVVVLLVAIVAVPIALGETVQPRGVSPQATTSGEASARSPIVVSKSLPGLRDYRRRLKDLKAADPFKQQFADAESAETAPTEEGGGGGAEPSAKPASPESGQGGGGGGGSSHTTHELKYYSWSIDVRVVPVSSNGKPSKAKPSVRRNLPELTMLPGSQTPAAIFIGPTSDEKKALMLISSNVTAVFGDAVCALGGETCEMLALEKGIPETFVYGANRRIFRIELLKIRLVETDKLNRAPLGKPKSGKRPAVQGEAAVGPATPRSR
jgi:hypothetical protein